MKKQVVKNYCKQCVKENLGADCGGSKLLSTEEPCVFYSFRMSGYTGYARLKDVRKNCLWCCGKSHKAVRECASLNCPLHQYRMGYNK